MRAPYLARFCSHYLSHSGMENGETPAGEGPRRDPTGSVNERGGLPAPPQESESFSIPRYSYMI